MSAEHSSLESSTTVPQNIRNYPTGDTTSNTRKLWLFRNTPFRNSSNIIHNSSHYICFFCFSKMYGAIWMRVYLNEMVLFGENFNLQSC